jgi:hypothetical protein
LTIPLFIRKHAGREASWFFRELGGKVPEGVDATTRAAAVQVDAWLRAIPSFHRGALDLRYVRRPWPKCIAREFGELVSVAVRLECALHPSVGISTEALERASAERLQTVILSCDRARSRRTPAGRERPMTPSEKGLARLARRAERHVELAVRALGRVRGVGPCLAPAPGAR